MVKRVCSHVLEIGPVRKSLTLGYLSKYLCVCLQAESNVNRTLNVFELHSVTKKVMPLSFLTSKYTLRPEGAENVQIMS